MEIFKIAKIMILSKILVEPFLIEFPEIGRTIGRDLKTKEKNVTVVQTKRVEFDQRKRRNHD